MKIRLILLERLLDDRRSLDDVFVVTARMLDIEKTLKNLDRAHKIRVRRCSADPCAKVIWTANYFENASKKRTKTRTANDRNIWRKSTLRTLENRPREGPSEPSRGPTGQIGRPNAVGAHAEHANAKILVSGTQPGRTRERNAAPAGSARGRVLRGPV